LLRFDLVVPNVLILSILAISFTLLTVKDASALELVGLPPTATEEAFSYIVISIRMTGLANWIAARREHKSDGLRLLSSRAYAGTNQGVLRPGKKVLRVVKSENVSGVPAYLP